MQHLQRAYPGRGVVMAAARLVAVTSASAERERLAWAALQDVPDPEVPVISVCDLGIVREVHALPEGQGMEIVLTPTYSGCPATEVIERSVLDAIEAAGLGPAACPAAPRPGLDHGLDQRRRPAQAALSTASRRPGAVATPACRKRTSPIRLVRRRQGIGVPEPVACPHCGSAHTERLSAFRRPRPARPCYRCLDCREPFEHFKPI